MSPTDRDKLYKALGISTYSTLADALKRVDELAYKADRYDAMPAIPAAQLRAMANINNGAGGELRKRTPAEPVSPHVEEIIKAAESGDPVAVARLARMLPRRGPPPPIGGRPR